MGNVRTPIFLAGVAVALLAFIAMFTFGIVFARSAQGGGDVRVVVATQDIEARQPIAPGMVQITSVASSDVAPFAFTKIGDLTGFAAVVSIYKGEVITHNVVSSNPDDISLGSASSYLPIAKGFVAVTLPTNEQQGVAGYIAAGDYIDVIATVNIELIQPGSNSPFAHRQVSRTVFTNVHVIRIGPPSSAPKQGAVQGVASSLTVTMTQCDADYLNWLLLNATLKYTLLAYPDYDTANPSPDPNCPSTSLGNPIGPSAVDTRWHFTQG
jgi:pilus assembly protein CpaB